MTFAFFFTCDLSVRITVSNKRSLYHLRGGRASQVNVIRLCIINSICAIKKEPSFALTLRILGRAQRNRNCALIVSLLLGCTEETIRRMVVVCLRSLTCLFYSYSHFVLDSLQACFANIRHFSPWAMLICLYLPLDVTLSTTSANDVKEYTLSIENSLDSTIRTSTGFCCG